MTDHDISQRVARRIIAEESIASFYAVPYEQNYSAGKNLLDEISKKFGYNVFITSKVSGEAFYGYIENPSKPIPSGKTELEHGTIQPTDSHGRLI